MNKAMNVLLSIIMYLLIAGMDANATVIDRGDYLTDTTTGLDWLDVTKSDNLSYDFVSNQFGSGGMFEGWRYATGGEFNALVGNYTGSTITYYGYVDQEVDKIDGLVQLLGSSLDIFMQYTYGTTWDGYFGYPEGEGVDYTLGFLADMFDINGVAHNYLALIYDQDTGNNYVDWSVAHYQYTPSWSSTVGLGSYLVRISSIATVPEPSPLEIICLGLAIISMVYRNKTSISDPVRYKKQRRTRLLRRLPLDGLH